MPIKVLIRTGDSAPFEINSPRWGNDEAADFTQIAAARGVANQSVELPWLSVRGADIIATWRT